MAIGPARRLDSWKEIADHIGRDVRTAIRWERERGLPVHRVPGGKRGSVFAFTDEVGRWLLSLGGEAGESNQPAASATAASGPAPEPSALGSRRALVTRRWIAGFAASLAVVALVGTLLRGFADTSRSGRTPVAAISLAGTQLTALDKKHQVLWRHDFGREVLDREDSLGDPGPLFFSSADDIDGDGLRDLLVVVPFKFGAAFGGRDELFAFSARGRVLWSRQLEETLTFGAGSFAPPWRSAGPLTLMGPQVAVFEVDGQKRIAWAQCHHTWWPSVLTVLDAAGRPLSKWVHSGAIFTVVPVMRPAGPRLLVGGVSNSREAAFLAVLDARHVEGSGPEEPGSPFECLSCGPGHPLRYFTIAPSELMLALGPYNHVTEVRPDATGVEVRTAEGAATSPFMVQAVARFSFTFDLAHAAWSSAWARVHRELERAGKLDHPVESCPERDRPPCVREWTPEDGWRDVTPAAVPATRAAESGR